MPIKGKHDIKMVSVSTTKQGHYKQAVYKEKMRKTSATGAIGGILTF